MKVIPRGTFREEKQPLPLLPPPTRLPPSYFAPMPRRKAPTNNAIKKLRAPAIRWIKQDTELIMKVLDETISLASRFLS